ncbi:MAG TPA: DsbA family protein [Gammaproteobacteria bacterium]|jgi:protein-disulfide isomerase|nr:DsbA family protein [Gammaproteobacteria bacterium]
MNRLTKFSIATSIIALNTASYAATATAAAPVSPAEQTKIEQVVHNYLISHPEVLMESMQALQQKQYQEAEKTIKETQKNVGAFSAALLRQANDPVAGNRNGKVTIVEFFDYQCPHCVSMAPVIESAMKANPELRVVFKELPIRGPASELAARAAIAANKQGKYYEFSHSLLVLNKPLTEEVIFTTAKNTGLNVDQLKKDMNDKSTSAQLEANRKLAQDLKLFGTPAIFIAKTNATSNITYVPGQMNDEQIKQAIDKETH